MITVPPHDRLDHKSGLKKEANKVYRAIVSLLYSILWWIVQMCTKKRCKSPLIQQCFNSSAELILEQTKRGFPSVSTHLHFDFDSSVQPLYHPKSKNKNVLLLNFCLHSKKWPNVCILHIQNDKFTWIFNYTFGKTLKKHMVNNYTYWAFAYSMKNANVVLSISKSFFFTDPDPSDLILRNITEPWPDMHFLT